MGAGNRTRGRTIVPVGIVEGNSGMSRLRRFENNQFVGTRDDMALYDCDDELQFPDLQRRVTEDDLLRRNLIQTSGPDAAAEARNRGFRPR